MSLPDMNITNDCCTTSTTTMSTINSATTTKSESGGIQSFKDLFLQLIEKDELHFAGWAILTILLLLIITCCIGCKGCCCRACCGARETRFTMKTCKLPGLAREDGHGIRRLAKEVAVVPITRCCYHPHHCTIDIERPFVCDCRRVCRTCSGYFTTSPSNRHHLNRDDLSQSPSPKPKPRKVSAEIENGKSSNGPQPYHKVQLDTMPAHDQSSSKTKQVRSPNVKGPAPTAPTAPDVGFNYSAMGFVDPKKPPVAQKPNEQEKPKDEEEEW